jgi:ADP-ribosylglycohydrolase
VDIRRPSLAARRRREVDSQHPRCALPTQAGRARLTVVAGAAAGHDRRVDATLRSRYRGAVLGQCLGDALGFPVEGYGPADCRAYVDEVLMAGRAGALGRTGFPFGQYTDDSQLFRELLESFVERGGFEPADYGRRVAALFSEGRVVGRGRATEQAAARLHAGVPWDRAGTPAPAAGNGSAMRAAAVALMSPAGGEALVRVAVDQGRVTHADPRCGAGAVAIAAAAARGLRGEPPRAEALCAELVALTAPIDASVADALARLPAWSALPPDQAVVPIAALGATPDHGAAWPGISPFVTSSVLWSLYSFVRSPDDWWRTVCTAIAVGGDVDTTAAMAGAIAGAHLGAHALPAALTAKLTDQGTWGHDELTDLADRTLALTPS